MISTRTGSRGAKFKFNRPFSAGQIPCIGRRGLTGKLNWREFTTGLGWQRIALQSAYAQTFFLDTVLTRFTVKNREGDAVVSRRDKNVLCIKQILGPDALLQFSEFNVSVVLVAVSGFVGELAENHHPSLPAPLGEVGAIQFHLDLRPQSLIHRKLRRVRVGSPSEMSLSRAF